jgi:hypothetical protein
LYADTALGRDREGWVMGSGPDEDLIRLLFLILLIQIRVLEAAKKEREGGSLSEGEEGGDFADMRKGMRVTTCAISATSYL